MSPERDVETAPLAAFLRGINLGRERRVSGDQLRSLFDGMGFQDVHTFRTSGNVIFGAEREPLDETAARIEQRLADTLGYEVAVFLRTASEVRTIAGHQPFPRSLVDASAGKLQVLMLSNRAEAHDRVLALATDQDRLAFGDRELYWLPSGGTQDSTLDLKAIEKLAGPTTMRTKGTIEQMAAKYFPG